MKTLTSKILITLCTLLVAIGAGEQNKYQTFGPTTSNSNCDYGRQGIQVTDINDSGQVLGWWCPGGEAYLINPGDIWTRNIVKTNGNFGAPAQGPIRMNNAATIIGQLGPSNRAFYKPWGQPAQIISVYSGVTVNAINNAGYMAGTSIQDAPNGQTVVYLTQSQDDEVEITFPHESGPPWGNDWNSEVVTGLNNSNQIVGSWEDISTPCSGFFYDGKKLNTTFNMPNAVTTYPTAINDNQEVVGNWFDGNGVEHGFYWNPTAGFSDIDVTGDTAMGLVAINNSSVILGWWQDDNTPTKIHYVTIVNGQPTAWVNVPKSQAGSTVATAINNVGQVVGEYETQEGVERGFIYTPSK